VSEAGTTMKIGSAAAGRVLEFVAENWPRVTSEKQHGAASNST